MPTNLGSLAFEHSKHVSKDSSLSSILVLDKDVNDDTHRLMTESINIHMQSISSQVFNFHTEDEVIKRQIPVLDFTNIGNFFIPCQLPVYAKLRKELVKLFVSLKEERSTEEIRKKYKIDSDPWDKYLILDSKYFLTLLCQSAPLSIPELTAFLQFILWSVKNETISMFKADLHEVRAEFLTFFKSLDTEVEVRLRKHPELVDAEWALDQINTKIIPRFYDHAKMKGWLRDYKDDYEELLK